MRRDMVTRTVLGTKATVKVVDNTTDVISIEEVMLGKAYTDLKDPKLAKAVKKSLADRPQLVIIHIQSVEPVNKLYGLDTAKFMEMAVELDPQTRKPVEA